MRMNEVAPMAASLRNRIAAWARLLFQAGVTVFGFVVSLHWITKQDLTDFMAFYGAAQRTLAGASPYGFYPTTAGGSVFQSVPWLAWLFAPLTFLPLDLAWWIYYLLNLGLVGVTLFLALAPARLKLTLLEYTLILACALAVSYPCLSFGQVSIIEVAALSVMMVALQRDQLLIAGACLPLALLKPHLILWFLGYAFIYGGRRFRLAGLSSTLLVALAALALQPAWPVEMFSAIVKGAAETSMEFWKYSTLASLFSRDARLGYLVPIVFLPLLFGLRRSLKEHPIQDQLAIVLAFSLATSPYAFAYDLPLLLPALAWLTRQWPRRAVLLWTGMAVLVYFAGFTRLAYLATLLVCALAGITLIVRPLPPRTPAESPSGSA